MKAIHEEFGNRLVVADIDIDIRKTAKAVRKGENSYV